MNKKRINLKIILKKGIDLKLETNEDEINELYFDLYLKVKKINFLI